MDTLTLLTGDISYAAVQYCMCSLSLAFSPLECLYDVNIHGGSSNDIDSPSSHGMYNLMLQHPYILFWNFCKLLLFLNFIQETVSEEDS